MCCDVSRGSKVDMSHALRILVLKGANTRLWGATWLRKTWVGAHFGGGRLMGEVYVPQEGGLGGPTPPTRRFFKKNKHFFFHPKKRRVGGVGAILRT